MSSSADAQEAVPVQLSYQAVPGCPEQARFVRRLSMHTQRLSLSRDPDALRLDVKVVGHANEFRGRLEVTRAGQSLGSREFQDADCREVVAALALSAALSIDPEATLQISDGEAPDGTDARDTDAPDLNEELQTTTGHEKQAPEPIARPPVAVGARTQSPKVPPKDETPGLSAPISWTAGPLLVASFNFTPHPGVGVGGAFGVSSRDGRVLLPLELVLELSYLSTGPTRDSDPVRLDWLSLRIVYCPVRLGTESALLACAGMQGGPVFAEGAELPNTRSVARSFFAAGLGLRGRLAVSESWALTGLVDFTLPLVERSFAIDPGEVVVSSTRTVGADVAVGALYGF